MRHFITWCAALALMAGCSEEPGTGDAVSGGTAADSGGSASVAPGESAGESASAAASGATAGFDSPEDAFAALRTAVQNDDFAAATRCLSRESQAALAEMITLPLAMMAAFEPSKEDEVKALLSKHGISTEDESDDFPVESIPDKVAYIADVMAWLEANSDETPDGEAPMEAVADGTLGELTYDGDSAIGQVTTADDQTEDMEFIRLDGRWYIHLGKELAMMADASAEPSMELDLSAQGPGFLNTPDEAELPTEAVSKEELEAAWRIDLNVTDQPAGVLLAQLAEELRLEFDQTDELQQPVSVSLSGQSRFAAIDAICQEIGMVPRYESADSSLTVVSEQRLADPLFVGPFLIEIQDLQIDAPTATGRIDLRVFTAGLPASLIQQMNEGMNTDVWVMTVEGPAGQDLSRENAMMGGGVWSGGSTTFDSPTSIGLRNLLRDVTEISSLEGAINMVIPVGVAEMTFDEMQPGTAKEDGELTLTLSEISGGEVSFEYSGLEDPSAVRMMGWNADGDPVESYGSGYFGSGDSGTLSQQFEDTPAKIDVRVVTETEALEFAFQFTDITVPDAESRPESLPELMVDGDVPLSLEFVRIGGEPDFPTAVFQAANHTNKDMETVTLELSFRNDSDEELETFPTSWADETIPAGETQEIEVSAFFMPEETKTVAGTVTQLVFTDASEWLPE